MRTPGLPLSRTFAAIFALALAIQIPAAQAGMIGAEALATPNQAELDRAKVQSFLDRANVKERMQAMGVNALATDQRVQSMTDAEVHALAERIDTLPAGGALSNQDLIIVLLIALLVVIAL